MNIEEMKTAWGQYNRKLELSQQLNQQMIMGILKERSRSRVARIRKENFVQLGLMVVISAFLIALLIGNPFDFRYTLQYIPYGMLLTGVLLATGSVYRSLRQFDVNLNKENLGVFLKRTIEEYEKTRKRNGWFGMIIFFAGTLTIFSFLPHKLEHKDKWLALAETGINLGITLGIYFIAFRLGAFKDHKREGFESDLRELEELRASSSELERAV
ncbi:hypothetical protein LZZ85_11695 [Terrimonas sp. NA20]|uniref:DUF4231 domain-containing protein n=1 Tax=Terrimonas ginsenosidimutans TaxID=2908004 RepID=A0ABS9KRI3_9BACT|nr:hypothetical protein [Terrimonas ginsenosidimutans]MCG2614952.1 hypothetical protein [Terrimonas ginsenosidimutans]